MPITPLQFYCVFIAVLSLITFVFFIYDKRQARTDGWRVSENTLLILCVAGGWPGGFIAQRVAHHKTRKFSFQFRYWLAVVVHIAVIYAIYHYCF